VRNKRSQNKKKNKGWLGKRRRKKIGGEEKEARKKCEEEKEARKKCEEEKDSE
jgi:hypothetical protein